jgi:hypothetical protein
MVGVWLDFDTSIIQPWPSTNKPRFCPEGGRRPAIWPIPLRSIGQIAGLLVLRTFTDATLHALVVLVLMLLGAIPTWPHSRNWGYFPSGALGIILIILIILLVLGKI